MKTLTPLLLLLLLSYTAIKAQDDNEIIEITGQIISDSKKKPISFANIVNRKNGRATVSDSLGFFHFTMKKNDVIRISAIGYKTANISFKDSVVENNKIVFIKMYRKIYELSKIDIYKARWKDFEFEFKNTEITKNETQDNIEAWFYSLISPEELMLIAVAATPVGIPINFKNKKDRKRIKVKEMEARDSKIQEVEKKFSREVVSQVTGLKGKKLENFMSFCNFKQEFLFEANEYDVVIEIKKRYNAYKKSAGANFR